MLSTIELSGSAGQTVCSVLAWWSMGPDFATCWKQGMPLSSFSFFTGPWSCYHLQVYLLHFLQVTFYLYLNHSAIVSHQIYGREVSILSPPNPCRHLLLVSKALSQMFFFMGNFIQNANIGSKCTAATLNGFSSFICMSSHFSLLPVHIQVHESHAAIFVNGEDNVKSVFHQLQFASIFICPRNLVGWIKLKELWQDTFEE